MSLIQQSVRGSPSDCKKLLLISAYLGPPPGHLILEKQFGVFHQWGESFYNQSHQSDTFKEVAQCEGIMRGWHADPSVIE